MPQKYPYANLAIPCELSMVSLADLIDILNGSAKAIEDLDNRPVATNTDFYCIAVAVPYNSFRETIRLIAPSLGVP